MPENQDGKPSKHNPNNEENMNKMVQHILRVSSKLAVAALVVAGTFGSAHAQTVINTPIWKKNALATNNATGAGDWHRNDNNTRGMAYNPATGNLLVVSRSIGLRIIRINAATGDSVGVLDVTGITGGNFALSLIDVTPTGRIFAANLTTNPAGNPNATPAVAPNPLKIYTWANESAVPEVAYSGTLNGSIVRYGDSFRLDWTDGARNVYVGGSGNPNLAKFTWANGALTLTSVFNFGAVNNTTMRAVRGMAPIAGEDSLWINEFAYTVKKISTMTGAIGTTIAAKPSGFDILKESLFIDYADIGGTKLFAAFPGSLVAAGQSASLVNASTNTELAFTAAGPNANGNGTGVVLFDVPRNRIYLLATNNHLAAYDISAFTPARVNVKFTVNTASIRDTVKSTDLVQIRGVVNNSEQTNYFGQTINWGSSSIALQNAGGDYWTRTLILKPGDVLKYKIYTGKPGAEAGSIVDHSTGGWEGGDDKFYTVPADATGDIVVPTFFFNRVVPFESKPDSVGIWFRVNVGAQFATGDVNNDSKVGVRGGEPFDWGMTKPVLTREPMVEGNRNVFYSGVVYLPNSQKGRSFEYKFVIENGGNITWEDGSNRASRVGQTDTSIVYGFFSGRRPPSRPVVQASLQFAVNVGVLEELGIFNRAKGDRVFVPGGFNGWNTAADGPGAATYNETFDTWTRAFNITEEVGATVAYKYFVRWAPGRFVTTSPDYIENLTEGAGWEEPGIAGGGNRIYTYTAGAVQTVTDADGVAYFNGVPPFGVIRETVGGFTVMPIKFTIDMTAALTHTTKFVPGTDSVFLAIQTPVWALTQGIPSNNDAFTTNAATRDRILFKRVGNTNVYELNYNMKLPADNHIGFAIAYRGPNTTLVVNGEGFDAGRRYYRYIRPIDASDRNNVIWPDSYVLNALTWKPNNLDFETPPKYTTTSIDRDLFDGADRFALAQNYPNPFNPSTSIAFNLPVSSDVTLSVYNVLGQKVATLANGPMTAGSHSVSFDASRLASGIYIYELRAGSFVQQRRMTLVK